MYFVVVCTTPQLSNIKSFFLLNEHHLPPTGGGKIKAGTAGGARGRGNCGQAMLYTGGRGNAVRGGQGLGWATRGATSAAVEPPVDEVLVTTALNIVNSN